MNRYSYVNNNPINFNDPTGHCVVGGHEMPDSTPACDNLDPADTLAKPKRKPPKSGDDPIIHKIVDPTAEEMPWVQDACEFILSGAPLFCDSGTMASYSGYYKSFFDENAGSMLGILSMFSDVIDEREWLSIKIPGFIGYGIDFFAQRDKDLGSYSAAEVHIRAHTVALQGQFTSYASLAASGLSAVGGLAVGPSVLILMGAAYVGSNVALTSAWSGLNDEFIFPAIHNVLN